MLHYKTIGSCNEMESHNVMESLVPQLLSHSEFDSKENQEHYQGKCVLIVFYFL